MYHALFHPNRYPHICLEDELMTFLTCSANILRYSNLLWYVGLPELFRLRSDLLYAFFLQWSPENRDDATDMGFIVVDDEVDHKDDDGKLFS